MWNLKIEQANCARAFANAQRVHANVAEFCAKQRALAAAERAQANAAEQRRATLVNGAPPPPAQTPRAWAPLVAAGLVVRPSGRRSGVER